MHRFANILVCCRAGAPSPSAIARFADLAAGNGAAMQLMSVLEPFPWYARLLLPAAEEYHRIRAQQAADGLAALASSMKRKELRVTTTVATGRPAIELIKEVLRSGHDLLIKVAEPDAGNGFGSVDLRLLRNCPCPVLLLHPDRQDRAFRKILVAVDPTPIPDSIDELHLREDVPAEEQALNAKLVQAATGLAGREGGEVHVLHAWTAPGEELLRHEDWVEQGEVEAYVESLRDENRQAVDRLLAQCPPGPAPRHVHLVKGTPAEVIAGFVRSEDPDLIVMGTVVRTGIPGLLIGNTAETVFHQVRGSVLAIKPDDFVSPVSLDD